MAIKKRVIIIHGWEGSPERNWIPWLKAELEKAGCEALAPFMPDTNHPKLGEWLSYLKEIAGRPDQNLYLVGHSLGVITILRYIESLGDGEKIGGAVLVAGFPEPIGYEELNSFFASSLRYEEVRKKAGVFVAINSDDEPYVPLKNAEILRDKLGAELIVIKGGKHLNTESGCFELPVALEKLKVMMA